MPVLNFDPARSWLSVLRVPPLRPIATFIRTAEEKFRPSRILPHRPRTCTAEEKLAAEGVAGQRATILREAGRGPMPTIVLGGFVPDATEQVFLLRRFLLQSGDVYYFNYPREGFCSALLEAQLDDLVAELTAQNRPPVIFGVSFGCGLVLEWLRRARERGQEPRLAGLVLVSPVASTADLIPPGVAKPATLLGRALQPYLDPTRPVTEASIERSRAIFTRMFEAGAQNKVALRALLAPQEVERLREAVMRAIRGITPAGACERVQAFKAMRPLTELFSPAMLPLAAAPTLVLFAEREDAVHADRSPTRFALERAHRAYFPRSRVRVVKARSSDAPVQHASLIFHAFEFLPFLEGFYRDVRNPRLPLAA